MALPSTLPQAINRVLDSVLDTDPATRLKLAALDGKSLHVFITTLSLVLRIKFVDRQLVLCDMDDETDPDVVIRGNLTELVKLLNEETQAASSGVEIQGDAGLLMQISRISAQLEIDWEAMVAKYVGDVPANVTARAAKKINSEVSGLHDRTQRKAIEWSQNNQQFAVTRTEFEQARGEIRQLQLDTDRLEAQIRAKKLHPENTRERS